MWSTAWCPLVTSLWNALKCSSGRLTTTNGKTAMSWINTHKSIPGRLTGRVDVVVLDHLAAF